MKKYDTLKHLDMSCGLLTLLLKLRVRSAVSPYVADKFDKTGIYQFALRMTYGKEIFE